MTDAKITTRTYLIVFALLMFLLLMTVLAGQLDLGPLNVAIALLIAAVKTVLVILYFMHVRISSPLNWIFAAAAFVWLGVLLGLTMSDYLTRDWLPRAEPLSHVERQ